MSEQSMNAFLTAADNDPALADRFVGAILQSEGVEAVQAVVDLAVSNGYDVTYEDADAARMRFAEAAAHRGEISDEELDGVSGGLAIATGIIAGSIIAFGTAGAVGVGGAIAGKIIENRDTAAVQDIGNFFSKW